MNVHYCPQCGRGFWCTGNLGEPIALPAHNDRSGGPCPSGLKGASRPRVPAVKPPGSI